MEPAVIEFIITGEAECALTHDRRESDARGTERYLSGSDLENKRLGPNAKFGKI